MAIFNLDPSTQLVIDFNHFILIGITTEGNTSTIRFAKIYLYGKIDDFQMLSMNAADTNFIQNSSINGSVEYLLTASTSVEYASSICETIEIYGIRVYYKVFDELIAEGINTTLICTTYESILAELSMIEQTSNAANTLLSPYLSQQLQMDRFVL